MTALIMYFSHALKSIFSLIRLITKHMKLRDFIINLLHANSLFFKFTKKTDLAILTIFYTLSIE